GLPRGDRKSIGKPNGAPRPPASPPTARAVLRRFDPMIIDVHLHFLSPHAIDAARTNPNRLGVGVLDGERPRLAVGAEPPTRPLLESLYSLSHHLAFLEAQGIDAAVFGPLMDVAGYSLPPQQGAAWSRAQNEGLAASLAAAGGHHVGLATVPFQSPAH